MTVLEAVFLGIVQGLTEFLPVSSSGHLVLFESILGRKGGDATFEIFLHFGTLLAVCIVFRKELSGMLRMAVENAPLLAAPRSLIRRAGAEPSFMLLAAILCGTIPAGLVGIIWGSEIESLFNQPRTAMSFLFVTAAILYSTRWSRDRGKSVSIGKSFVIGLAQALAILPGISRSGTTISAALHLGISRVEAARFSFLLSVPAILGATVLKSPSLFSGLDAGLTRVALFAGTATAFLVGYASILVLLKIIEKHGFHLFSIYCVIAALAGFLLLG